MTCCCGGRKSLRARKTTVSCTDTGVNTVNIIQLDKAEGTGILEVEMTDAGFTSAPVKWFASALNRPVLEGLAQHVTVKDLKNKWVYGGGKVKLVAEFKSSGNAGAIGHPSTDLVAAVRAKQPASLYAGQGGGFFYTFIELADGSEHVCKVKVNVHITVDSVHGGNAAGGAGAGSDTTPKDGGGGGSPCLTLNFNLHYFDENTQEYKPISFAYGYLGWYDVSRQNLRPNHPSYYAHGVANNEYRKYNSASYPITGKVAIKDPAAVGGIRLGNDPNAPDGTLRISVSQSCIRFRAVYTGIMGGGSVIFGFKTPNEAKSYMTTKLGSSKPLKLWYDSGSDYSELVNAPPNRGAFFAATKPTYPVAPKAWHLFPYFAFDRAYEKQYHPHAWQGFWITEL